MRRLIVILVVLISHVSFGQELVDYNLSSCEERSYPEYIRSRVIYKNIENDTLGLRLGLVLNCCIDPAISLSFRNDSLFVQIDNIANSICACECCFEIEITATGFEDIPFEIIYKKPEFNFNSDDFETIYVDYTLEMSSRKYIFPNPEEVIAYKAYNGRFNQLTEDSLKFGLWENSKDSLNYLTFHYINDLGVSKMEWGARFNKDGLLLDICGRNGFNELTCASRREYLHLFGIDDSDE